MAAETALGAKMAVLQTKLQTIHRRSKATGAEIFAVAGSGRGPDSLALDGRPGVGTGSASPESALGAAYFRFREI